MKIYKLRARTMRSDGHDWLAEVDAEELRRALAADPLDVEMAAPTTIHVNVSGNLVGTEGVAAAVREAVNTMRPWRPRSAFDRRSLPQPINWIDRRRQHWYVTGRRRTDFYRSRDRRRGPRRVLVKLWPSDMNQRTAWFGRRRDDPRAERRHGLQRRLRSERRTTQVSGFWRHQCSRSVIEFIGLWSAYCPDCGVGYTTVNDRRLRLSSRREFPTDRRRP